MENEVINLGSTGTIGHLTFNDKTCPKCGSTPDKHEVRNYNPIWRDGDVYCMVCNTKVRDYDAG